MADLQHKKLPQDNSNTKLQIRDVDTSDAPETNIPDSYNHDLRDNIEASLKKFLDRPLTIESALTLSCEALDLDLETVGTALDNLVVQGFFIFKGGLICKAEGAFQDDIYGERISPDSQQVGNSPNLPLEAGSEFQSMPYGHMYEDAPSMEEEEPELSFEDKVLQMAKEYASGVRAAQWNELSLEEQAMFLEDAESNLLQDMEKTANGEQLQKESDMNMSNPPQPNADAPSGWMEYTDSSGKKSWKPKDNPNSPAKIEDPSSQTGMIS